MAWQTIHYGAYEINKSGTVRRVKPSRGTRVGKILKPYYWKTYGPIVKLHWNGRVRQVTIDTLLRRAFR